MKYVVGFARMIQLLSFGIVLSSLLTSAKHIDIAVFMFIGAFLAEKFVEDIQKYNNG